MSKRKRRKKQDLTPDELRTLAWGIACLMSISGTQALGAPKAASYGVAALLFVVGVTLFVLRRVASGHSPLPGFGSLPRGSSSVSLAGVDAMSGREFEHLVADLCRRDGCSHRHPSSSGPPPSPAAQGISPRLGGTRPAPEANGFGIGFPHSAP
jgi:hypothetical protein